MAKTPAGVYDLLNQLWTPARAVALKEAAALQADGRAERIRRSRSSRGTGATTPRRSARHATTSTREALRPYFPLDGVRDGAFYVANRLYGITITRRADLPVYHADVQAFEVKDADGSHLGVLYMDFFPRPGKNGGAWQDSVRPQWVMRGREVRPVVTTVFNFPRPTGDDAVAAQPGRRRDGVPRVRPRAAHAARRRCRTARSRSVPTDFVELPSQIMENWATEPEVLRFTRSTSAPASRSRRRSSRS